MQIWVVSMSYENAHIYMQKLEWGAIKIIVAVGQFMWEIAVANQLYETIICICQQ